MDIDREQKRKIIQSIHDLFESCEGCKKRNATSIAKVHYCTTECETGKEIRKFGMQLTTEDKP